MANKWKAEAKRARKELAKLRKLLNVNTKAHEEKDKKIAQLSSVVEIEMDMLRKSATPH